GKTVKKKRSASLPQECFFIENETKRETYIANNSNRRDNPHSATNSEFLGRINIAQDLKVLPHHIESDVHTNVSDFSIRFPADGDVMEHRLHKSSSNKEIKFSGSSQKPFLMRNMIWQQ